MITGLVIFLMAPLLFKAETPANIGIHFAGLALFLLASLGVEALPGLFVKNAAKLTILSQPVFLPSAMLSGIMFLQEFLPKTLIYIGKIFPATWG